MVETFGTTEPEVLAIKLSNCKTNVYNNIEVLVTPAIVHL